MLRLPIDNVLPQVIAGLKEHSSLVLQAATGAGKTTRVPPALWHAGLAGSRQVLVLQPRRVAARAVARRIAEEFGVRLGDDVGYQVRFDQQTSSRTRIVVMTEGILLRRLQSDPFLDDVGVVVLDEFHERHLETDLALAMVYRVQQTVRPDLRLVVMSATLDAGPLVEYLNGAPFVDCPVPRFPVEIRYLSHSDDRPLALQAASATERVLQETAGDVLVFLPGVREIRQTQERLSAGSAPDVTILPLYGELPPEQQDRVFDPSPGRKVILGTNVAETSLTIPGITTVIDSGWARILDFDARLGLNELTLQPISQASADQRTGRAGRTGPGLCCRLWTEASQRSRPAAIASEMERVDLSGVVLQLLAWGERDIAAFPWFVRPPQASLVAAERLLVSLGAMRDGAMTEFGQSLAKLPLSPRLAALVVTGWEGGDAERAALAAALLSERDPFLREGMVRRAAHHSPSDVLDRVDALREFARNGRTEFPIGTLHRGGAQSLLQSAQQLRRIVGAAEKPSNGDDTALLRALLAAFPDRLIRRREGQLRRGVMVGGRGVRLAEQSAIGNPELSLGIDVDGGSTDEALVRMASTVERDWLPEQHLTTAVEVEFDEAAERVQARRRVRWLDLMLEESPVALPESAEVAEVLATAAQARWPRVFPADDAALTGLIERVHWLHRVVPEMDLPRWNDEELRALLPTVCAGRRALKELSAEAWKTALLESLTHEQSQRLDQLAPERITVPSGSRLTLRYAVDQPPVLEVRIQEMFGCRETPQIAGGRVPIVLHLLAPNYRPQQITDDLASFWRNAYPLVRRELQRKYPKHAWPEDPLTAEPLRGPKRKTTS